MRLSNHSRMGSSTSNSKFTIANLWFAIPFAFGARGSQDGLVRGGTHTRQQTQRESWGAAIAVVSTHYTTLRPTTLHDTT